ncbi:MAG: extracellular solute-binding protein, partial [Phycisphaerae bacterium]|nr:extracellular solute-binding protein [Phycisphaerae bacterium]
NLLSEDGTRVTFDTPEVVRALRFVVDLHDDVGGIERVNRFQQSLQTMALDPFVQGQIAMKIDNDWMFRFMALFRPDMDFVIAPAPLPADRVAAGERPITWAGGFSLVIPATARNKAGAFRLIQFITSWRGTQLIERGKRELAESEGRIYLPEGLANRVHFERLVREAIDENPRVPRTFKDAYKVLRELMPNTKFRPVSPIGQALWNAQMRASEMALQHRFDDEARRTGQDPIVLALRAAARPAQQQLDEVLRPPPPTVIRWTPWVAAYAAAVVVVPLVAMVVGYRLRRRVEGYRGEEVRAAFLFALPWWVGFSLLTGGPILFSVLLSFSRYDALSPARWVGIQNYRDVLTDPLFYKSMANTLFMLLRVPIGMALSLAIAMLLNRAIRGIGAYRTALFMPAIVPLVAASLLWMWMFNPTQGPINGMLSWMGIEGPNWLQSERWSKPALILMSLWSAGGGMIIWLAGLQSIPQQLYEAASIDGAGAWRRFFHVTIPMLSPFILFNAIVGVIATMQIFAEVYIMTPEGRPADSTLVYTYYLFKQAFQYFRMGYASALAWILFLIVLGLTLVQLWLGKRWVHYEQA